MFIILFKNTTKLKFQKMHLETNQKSFILKKFLQSNNEK